MACATYLYVVGPIKDRRFKRTVEAVSAKHREEQGEKQQALEHGTFQWNQCPTSGCVASLSRSGVGADLKLRCFLHGTFRPCRNNVRNLRCNRLATSPPWLDASDLPQIEYLEALDQIKCSVCIGFEHNRKRVIERAGFGRSSAGQPLKADPLVRSKKAKIPWRLRYDVFERDKHTCQSCGAKRKDGVELQVDHIKPESKGGKMNMGNLQTLCKECNVGKGNRYSTDLRA
jgi:hypothetical protein